MSWLRSVTCLVVSSALLAATVAAQPAATAAASPAASAAGRIGAPVSPAIDRTTTSRPAARHVDTRGLQRRSVKTAKVTPVLLPAPKPAGPTHLTPLQGSKVARLSSAHGRPRATDPLLSDAEVAAGLLRVVPAARQAAARAALERRSLAHAAAAADVGHATTASSAAAAELAQTTTASATAAFASTAVQAASTSTSDDPPLRSVQVSPADNAVSVGVTPTLKAKVAEPLPGVTYTYDFTVCPVTTANGTSCGSAAPAAESGSITSGTWQVPAGKLATNKTYSWTVSVSTGFMGTMFNDVRVFATGATLSAPDTATPVLVSPADVAVLSTRTPTLKASISRPVSGSTYQYQYSVSSFDDAISWQSSWTSATSIVVPSNALYWNRGYTWSVAIRDNPYMGTMFNPQRSFYPIVPVAPTANLVTDRYTPFAHGVSVSSGAFTSTATDAAVRTVGTPLAVARIYRSTDTTVHALGTGWSSLLDMLVSTPSGAPGPVVRFADGHEETFAANPDGSFAGAPGNGRTQLSKCSTCTVYTVIDETGARYTVDAKGITGATDAAGHATTVTRDTSGHPTVLKDVVSGRTLTLTWSGTHVASIAATPAPSGTVSTWTYTYSTDRLTKACAPRSGSTVACTTYAYGNTTLPSAITTVTSAAGRVRVRAAYTTGSVATSVTDAAGITWSFARSTITGGSRVAVTGSGGGTTTYDLDSQKRLVRQQDPVGAVQTWAYDALGRLGRYVNGAGGALELGYDRYGRIIRRTTWRDADLSWTQRYTYYASGAATGQLQSILDPRNGYSDIPLTTFVYDTKGRLSATVHGATGASPASPQDSYTYTDGTEAAAGGGTTPAGLLKTSTDAVGAVTRYAYASNGSLSSTTEPSGLVTTFGYDSLGRVTSRASTAGSTTATTTAAWYDDSTLRSVTEPTVVDPVSGVTRHLSTTTNLDLDGNPTTVVRTDLSSGTAVVASSSSYDASGRVISVTRPGGAVTKTTYDGSGNVATLTDARGAVTRFGYDAAGHLLTTTVVGYVDPVVKAAPRDVVVERLGYDGAGRVVSRTDAAGQVWRYGYTRDDLLSTVTAVGAGPTGADVVQRRVTYDAAGNPVAVALADDALRVTYTYDDQLRPTEESIDSRTIDRTFDAAGRVTSQALSTYGGKERFDRYTYDAGGRLVRRESGRDQTERVDRMAYDALGRVVSVTDPRASTAGDPAWTTSYTYDPTGRLQSVSAPPVSVTDAAGTRTIRPTTRDGYDGFGRLSVQENANGARVTTQYDVASRPVEVRLPSGPSADGSSVQPTYRTSYDAAGDVVGSTDPLGRSTSYVYDPLGRLVSTSAPAAAPGQPARTMTTAWSDNGQAVRFTDAVGDVREAAYDRLGRQVADTTVAADGTRRSTTFDYDAANNLTTITAPSGARTIATYDALGERLSSKDADGVTTSYGYDAAGRVTKVANGAGDTTTTEYSGLGLPTKQTVSGWWGTAIRTSTATYDAAGNVVHQSAGLDTGVDLQWDAVGRLVKQVAADGTSSTSGYDAAGQRTLQVDARGNRTSTTYNVWGLRSSVVEPATDTATSAADRTWAWGYDVALQPVQQNAPGGVALARTFDDAGRLIKESGSGGGAVAATRDWTFDDAGRLTSVSHPAGRQDFGYDDRGLLVSSSGPSGASMFGYDVDGRLTQRQDGSGTTTLTWTAAGRVASTTLGARTWTSSYDSAGRLSTQTLPGGANRRLSYDSAGNVVSDSVVDSQYGTVLSRSLAYDAAGRLVSEQRQPSTAAGGGTTQYGYDSRSRVTSWTEPTGATHAIGYDATSNITSYDGRALAYDAQNHLVSSGSTTYAWSPRGTQQQVTTSGIPTNRSFDAFDRLTSDGTSAFRYDGLDRIATVGSTSVGYSGTDQEPVSMGTSTWSRDASGRTLSVGDLDVVTTERGDVVGGLQNGTGKGTRSFAPFGTTSTSVGTDLGRTAYQGSWAADSGLVHMGARWYDPTSGSFVSRDSVDLPAGADNRYAYTSGNPVTGSDPTGHLVCFDTPAECMSIVSGVGAAAGGGAAAGAEGGAAAGPIAAGVAAVVVAAGATYCYFKDCSLSAPGDIFAGGLPGYDYSAMHAQVQAIANGAAMEAAQRAMNRASTQLGGITSLVTSLNGSLGITAGPLGGVGSAFDVTVGAVGGMTTTLTGVNSSLSQTNQAISSINSAVHQINAGLHVMNGALDGINSALDGVDVALDSMTAGINQAVAGIDQMVVAIDQMAAGIDQMNLGIQQMLKGLRLDWATTPDHSESLTVRPDLLERPTGFMPVDSARLCAISSRTCLASANSTPTCATGSLQSSCSVVAPTAPRPAAAGGGTPPPKKPSTTACSPQPRGSGVNEGDVGSKRSLDRAAQTGDDLEANHVIQAASLGQFGVSYGDGAAVVLTAADHRRTRTWGSRGAVTKAQDAGRPFKDILYDDYDDLRGLGLCFDVESSIDQLSDYWQGMGMLP